MCQVVPNSKSEVAGGLGTEVDLWHCQQVVGSSTVGKAYDCAAKTHKQPIRIVIPNKTFFIFPSPFQKLVKLFVESFSGYLRKHTHGERLSSMGNIIIVNCRDVNENGRQYIYGRETGRK